jgi:DEAD/DEAH box helicase domain-containing protein
VKNRVRAENGELCCIGTSATIGGEDSVNELCDYAGKIFGEHFDESSLIRETMMNAEQFRKGESCRYFIVPDSEQLADMQSNDISDPEAWLRTQYKLWFGDEPGADMQSQDARLELGTKLLGHRFTSELLSIYEQKGTEVLNETEVHKALLRMERGLSQKSVFRAALDSFLALCAHARYKHPVSGRIQPFLRLHVQLWMRELTHMVTLKPKDSEQAATSFNVYITSDGSLSAMEMVTPDGDAFRIEVRAMRNGLTFPKETFTYQPKDFPADEIIDMR